MSRVALPNGDDHPEAAAKHLLDCSLLQAQGRHDGAGYLAGYVIECCLKTLILVDGLAPGFVHFLSALNQEAIRLAALPGSQTARYAPWHSAGHPIYNRASGWDVALRYQPEHILPALAQRWVEEAHLVFSRTVVPLRLDGMI